MCYRIVSCEIQKDRAPLTRTLKPSTPSMLKDGDVAPGILAVICGHCGNPTIFLSLIEMVIFFWSMKYESTVGSHHSSLIEHLPFGISS